MSGRRLRSGKILPLERINKQQNYSEKKAVNLSESNMAAAELLEELKSMRLDLTVQITKLSDDLKDFQRNTNERLQKIESVMFKVDEIATATRSRCRQHEGILKLCELQCRRGR